MGNGSDERDERGRHSELNHDCVTRRRRATNIFKVMSSFEGSQYQLRHLESTSRTSREFIIGGVTIGFVCFSTHPRRTQDGFKSARHVDHKPYFIDVKHV